MAGKLCFVWSVLILVTAALWVPRGPVAAAVPTPPGVADSPTLPITTLGLDPDLALYGQAGTATLTVPVPAGMTPATLNITTQLPVNVRGGTITVSQGNRVLAQADIPALRGPLVIPLAGVQVVENSISVLLRSYLLPLEGYCLDPSNPLRLVDASLTYAGLEKTPRAVADFLPPVLRRLVIYTRPDSSQTESNAVVRLATAIAARYGKQNPIVDVAPLSVPPAQVPVAGPFERHIVVSEGPDAGVSIVPTAGMPALLVSGSAADLDNQTRLITSRLANYALSSKAVVGPLNAAPQLAGNDTTIRKLGQPGVNATALNPQVGIALDQTRLGRAAHLLRVHLLGSYTPLPDNIGGQVVATVAGETVARWSAQSNGVIDRWVDIPDRVLRRYTTLAVQVNISGNTGRCGEFQPITLTIDGESAVHSEPARPPVPRGFQSLPQAFMPRVLVGIGADRFADTVRAVQIMVGLQRLSALPIDTAVVPLAEASKSSNPAVLISPQGWNDPAVVLPVSAPKAVPMTFDVLDDSGAASTLTLEPGLKFGSLQVISDSRRTVLVATSNGAPDRLDELLRWLSSDERRWSDIDGIALVSVADRDPVTVATPEQRGDRLTTVPSIVPWWWIGGGFLALIVAATAWLRVREWRRARAA